MDDRLDTEIRRQIGVAAAYSHDPENIQAHLDSWADRHIRARVRLVDYDEAEHVDTLTLGIEMAYVAPKRSKDSPAKRPAIIDRVATFVIVSVYASAAVLLLGASVGLARWMGGTL